MILLVWLQGTLPAYWGGFQAFPKLRKLNLAFNPRLIGNLSADWGSDGTSMQALSRQGFTNSYMILSSS